MSDDNTKSNGHARKRIKFNQEYELRDWSKKFGVTPDRLMVAAVGDRADKVELYLKDGR